MAGRSGGSPVDCTEGLNPSGTRCRSPLGSAIPQQMRFPSSSRSNHRNEPSRLPRCRWRSAVLALTLVHAANVAGVAGQDKRGRLELEELSEVSLPSGFTVLGARFIDSLHAVAWGPEGLLSVDLGPEPRAASLGQPTPVRGVRLRGTGPEGQRYEVIDPAGHRSEVGSDGVTVPLGALPGEGEVVQAVPVGDWWLVHRRHGDELDPGLVAWNPNVPGNTAVEPVDPPDGGWAAQLRLVVGVGEAFIQEMVHPHAVYRFTAGAHGQVLVRVIDGELIQKRIVADGFPSEDTVALPLLPLGDGYLYQLTHMASDARLLITMNAGFEILRSAVVLAPIGFITASPRIQLLLGMVDTGAPELRVYRWRWSGESRD